MDWNVSIHAETVSLEVIVTTSTVHVYLVVLKDSKEQPAKKVREVISILFKIEYGLILAGKGLCYVLCVFMSQNSVI